MNKKHYKSVHANHNKLTRITLCWKPKGAFDGKALPETTGVQGSVLSPLDTASGASSVVSQLQKLPL